MEGLHDRPGRLARLRPPGELSLAVHRCSVLSGERNARVEPKHMAATSVCIGATLRVPSGNTALRRGETTDPVRYRRRCTIDVQ